MLKGDIGEALLLIAAREFEAGGEIGRIGVELGTKSLDLEVAFAGVHSIMDLPFHRRGNWGSRDAGMRCAAAESNRCNEDRLRLPPAQADLLFALRWPQSPRPEARSPNEPRDKPTYATGEGSARSS